MVRNKSYKQLSKDSLSFSLFRDLRYSLIRVVVPLIRLRFSLKGFTKSKSLTKLTSLYLLALSSLSRAKISLPTYHIYSMTATFPPCVSSFVMSIISRITSWLLSTSKSRIFENLSVVITSMNCLHSKNLKWIDRTSSNSCWFWIDFYRFSFSRISKSLLRKGLFYWGLLKYLTNCKGRYGSCREYVCYFCSGLYDYDYFYFYALIAVSYLINTSCTSFSSYKIYPF